MRLAAAARLAYLGVRNGHSTTECQHRTGRYPAPSEELRPRAMAKAGRGIRSLSKQQGAPMTNRREILQGGIALTSLPLVARGTWAAPEAAAYSSHALYRILFDSRFSESRAFGAE